MNANEQQALIKRVLNDEQPETNLEAFARESAKLAYAYYMKYIKPINEIFKKYMAGK